MSKNVKIIFCDNACEKNTLDENCAENFEGVNFEFTSLDTQQKNGILERGFTTFYSRIHTMVEHTGL